MSVYVCVRACSVFVVLVVLHCVSVHVFVHGASKQSRKRENEDKPTGILIGVYQIDLNPTPTCAKPIRTVSCL